VDFLVGDHEFPGGTKTPSRIDVVQKGEFPVGTDLALLKLKLNSMREKDLFDAIALVRRIGRVPSVKELGALNSTQRENLKMVQTWLAARPGPAPYGE
jgi:hypothetical protein